jgi:5-methylcytosine-specific restriction protein A
VAEKWRRPPTRTAKPQAQRYAEDRRASAYRRGYTRQWQKDSKHFLAMPENALCRECERHGAMTAATLVDHIQPHRGNMELFWNVANWQPLCKRCHDRKKE